MERGDCFGHPSAADLSLSAEVIPSSYRWTFPEVFPSIGCAEVLENRRGEYSRLQVWSAGTFFDDYMLGG